MTAGMSNAEEVMEARQQVIDGGMQRGGPRGGCEAFLRFAAGDEAFEVLDPQLRERLLENGEIFLGTEIGVMEPYQPDEPMLATVEVPVRVMVGTESAPFFAETAQWLADRLRVEVERLPGGHTPYFDRPEEMAQMLRPLLRELSG
jgi:pimeloyl-ACP methyl ester carboxylesterase